MSQIQRRISSTRARQELYVLVQSLMDGNDPVHVLHRGQPAAVLVSDTEYRRLLAHVQNPSALRRGLKGCIKVTPAYARPTCPPPACGDDTRPVSTLVSDTEPFLWYACGLHQLLPPAVLSAFEDAVAGRRTIILPITTLYELGVLEEMQEVKLNVALSDLLKNQFFARTIEIENIEPDDVLFASLPGLPGDFSDKIALAIALRKHCPLITANLAIHNAAVCPVFWQ